MIVLSDIKSKDLHKIIDYIYHGEVQLLRDDLDDFLATAQKLQIDGLIHSEDEQTIKEEAAHDDEDISDEVYPDPEEEEKPVLKTAHKRHYRGVSTNTDARSAVDEIVQKIENGHKCKQCGKTGNSSDIRRHAEIHIEGLAFQCQLCSKSFR